MTYLINKNTAYYGSGSKLIDLMDAFNPGKGTLRKVALLAFIGVSFTADTSVREYNPGITCAVPEKGTPFLYDNDTDLVVGHEYSSIQGSVVFESFRRSVLSVGGYDAASEDALGHCRFFIVDEVTGEKQYYTADAFPTSVTGSYDMLNPQFMMQ
ncbi:MAG: hypothetical protein CMH31_01815 [Micavibrio sp.]|nr:hypothetical protein [Micavibrio sp.]|tara:strand:+ start:49 stop:513 length:465 start_codon:yes stop_codon:yes gene_type:complete